MQLPTWPKGIFSRMALGLVLACAFICSGRALAAERATGPAPADLVRIEPVKRTPVLARPHVFPLNGVKYTLFMNYLHEWIDRPLFYNRAFRDEEKGALLTWPGFQRDLESGLSYEIDGYAILIGTPGMLQRYLDTMDFIDRAVPKDFFILPEFATGGLGPNGEIEALVEYQARVIERALASPHSFRIGGKIVIGSYVADNASPEVWKRVMDAHRAKFGDSFLFIVDSRRSLREVHEQFKRHDGMVSRASLEKLRASLRSYLDVSDGIMFGGPNHMTAGHERRLDARFYEEGVARIYAGVLEEPKYRGKLLVLGAALGYVNHRSGSTQHEDGTRHLRRTMEIAMQARADIIVLPEWGEFNENTCIMPTVANSLSTQRVMRHYMRQMKGLAPASNEGDDRRIPNLLVSYRRELKLGMPLEIELLHLPDGVSAGSCTAQLALKSLEGKVVRQFPEATFSADAMGERYFTVPSEELAGTLLLRPSLSIRTQDGRAIEFEDGLHAITVRPTANWDYKWVKMPLRDLCTPASARFEVAADAERKGSLRFTGAVECGEPIASVEVLEDGVELYSVDRLNEFPDARTHLILMARYLSYREQPFTGTMTLRGADLKMYPAVIPKTTVKGNTVRVNFKTNTARREIFLAIPREQAREATLDVNFNLVKATVPVSQILENGAVGLSGPHGFLMTLEELRILPDLPVQIGEKKVEFDVVRPADRLRAVYHMRVVTVSGKVYRSRPVLMGAAGGPVPLEVFSETTRRPVRVTVDRNDIPVYDYRFTPACGALLPTPAGREFFGELGGGGHSSGPFTRGFWPKEATQAAPTWTAEDGAQCLEFDGVGNVVTFPLEFVPSGAFTLRFDIKPLLDRSQILFTCHTAYVGPVQIRLEKGGRLVVIYRDDTLTPHKLHEFGVDVDSGMRAPIGEWSKVEISYDLHRFRVRVNGRDGRDVPCSARGYSFSAAVFGGHGRDSSAYFKGFLKSLYVSHRAEF